MCEFCDPETIIKTIASNNDHLEVVIANCYGRTEIYAFDNCYGNFTDSYYPKYCPECGRKLRDD